MSGTPFRNRDRRATRQVSRNHYVSISERAGGRGSGHACIRDFALIEVSFTPFKSSQTHAGGGAAVNNMSRQATQFKCLGRPRIVILGAGFAGLSAAQEM